MNYANHPHVSNLIQTYRDVLDYTDNLDDTAFASSPLEGKWSPAQHLPRPPSPGPHPKRPQG